MSTNYTSTKYIQKILMFICVICATLFLTGCEEPENRTVELDVSFKIANQETVNIDGGTFTITRLGNATCDWNAQGCDFDGLKVEYEFNINGETYTKKNIDESDYLVGIGGTDYKNYVNIIITKIEKELED